MFPRVSSYRLQLLQGIALCVATLFGCIGDGDELPELDDEEAVGAYGTMEGMLSGSSVLSANGTYGANCTLHRNQSWSVPFTVGAPLDNAALQVAKLDSACTLALTALRTGSGASNLYVANAPVALNAAYGGGALFTSSAGTFGANAKITSTSFATTFGLTVLVAEDVQNNALGASTYISFPARVMSDSPVSYWRLDDSAPSAFSAEDFTGTPGATLQTFTGSTGVSWTKHAASGTDVLLSSAGRIRVNTSKKAVYMASSVPSSADYIVSADIYAASLLGDDFAGVTGRTASANETFYFAGVVATYQLALIQTRRFELWKFVSGTPILLGWYSSTFTAGSTSRVTLELRGSSIRASLDGVERINVTDTSITTAGAPGVLLGSILGAGQSDTTGMHLDNFAATQLAQARDSKSTNHGLLDRGVTLGAAGAFVGSNTSVTFDGVDDYIEMTRQIGTDFSIELWFKSTQGLGAANVTQWYQTAGLVDANASFANNDFGIGLRSDGRILAGTGKANCVVVCFDDDQTIVSTAGTTYNDGVWHHVVFTRTRATGAAALYVDGVAKGSLASGSTNTLDSATKINIGRLQTGSNYFAGSIDEVAVYSSVLSAATVQNHYRAGRR